MASDVVGWLLDSDPALRWQVERDLAHAPGHLAGDARPRRDRGFRRAAAHPADPDGQWAGGAYFPADFDFAGPEAAEGAGQPWTATTWALNTLRDWGLDAAVLGDTAQRLAANSRWEYENLPYWGGEVDCCINAFTVANGAWLGADVSGIVAWFLEHRMTDGGWNCEWVEGSTVSSFHSTLNALKGLLFYESVNGGTDGIRAARRGGEEYLLRRYLYKRLSSGEPVAPWVSRFVYPFRWFYSVLNAAEYFREASFRDDRPPDLRMAEAIEQIRAARQPDGTWIQEGRHPGRVWFEVDVDSGQPSKWLTHSATRVLEWWDAQTER
jgi:hypothetical protein